MPYPDPEHAGIVRAGEHVQARIPIVSVKVVGVYGCLQRRVQERDQMIQENGEPQPSTSPELLNNSPS